MKRLPVILLAISTVLLFSCDKIDDPFPPDNSVSDTGIVWDDSVASISNAGIRFILLEEYTGHTCINCPAAAVEAERLKDLYGDKFIQMAIHATETFAAPKHVSCAPADAFQTDHRTDESLEYENELSFGVAKGLPRGMISRTGESITHNKWQTEADKIFNSSPDAIANIGIRNFFDDSSKVFRTDIDIIWLQDYTGGINLQVQVLEDSIVDWQQIPATDPCYIEEYVFNHMYRGAVNTAWGNAIDAAGTGDTSHFSFTRSVEDYLGRGNTLASRTKSGFSDFSIVAFIYKVSPDFEVMQANSAHLTGSH